MLYIMIHAVAALAGKALIVAKFALAIGIAALLKKALGESLYCKIPNLFSYEPLCYILFNIFFRAQRENVLRDSEASSS